MAGWDPKSATSALDGIAAGNGSPNPLSSIVMVAAVAFAFVSIATGIFTTYGAVLKAIAEHDVLGARAAMQRHLNKAYKRFNKGWNTLH